MEMIQNGQICPKCPEFSRFAQTFCLFYFMMVIINAGMKIVIYKQKIKILLKLRATCMDFTSTSPPFDTTAQVLS